MAKAATTTIVEAENIVPIGSLDPNDIHLPGIFVDRIVPSTAEKTIEILKLRDGGKPKANGVSSGKDAGAERRQRIGRRASQELQEGFYVNLGVGECGVPCCAG